MLSAVKIFGDFPDARGFRNRSRCPPVAGAHLPSASAVEVEGPNALGLARKEGSEHVIGN